METVTLGKIDLSKFVHPISTEPFDSIDREISKLEGYLQTVNYDALLTNEKQDLDTVKIKLGEHHREKELARLKSMYRTINLKFLSTPLIVYINRVRIRLPKFAVHSSTWSNSLFAGFDSMKVVFDHIGRGCFAQFSSHIINQPLERVESSLWRWFRRRGPSLGVYFAVEKLLKRLAHTASPNMIEGRGEISKVSIATSFVGIVPEKTKEAIDLAQPDFNHQIFLIRETTPKDWRVDGVTMRTTDPLVIGIKHNTAFLLDIFDTTPLEQHIAETMSTPEVE